MTCDKGFKSTVSRLYNSMCLSPLIQLDTHQINKWKPQSCNGLFFLLFFPHHVFHKHVQNASAECLHASVALSGDVLHKHKGLHTKQ